MSEFGQQGIFSKMRSSAFRDPSGSESFSPRNSAKDRDGKKFLRITTTPPATRSRTSSVGGRQDSIQGEAQWREPCRSCCLVPGDCHLQCGDRLENNSGFSLTHASSTRKRSGSNAKKNAKLKNLPPIFVVAAAQEKMANRKRIQRCHRHRRQHQPQQQSRWTHGRYK